MKKTILKIFSAILFLVCMMASRPIYLADSESTANSGLTPEGWVEAWAEGGIGSNAGDGAVGGDVHKSGGGNSDGTGNADGIEGDTGNTDGADRSGKEDPPKEYDVTLMALGDNLLHEGIINTGRMEDGSYDYSFLFEGISAYLEKADIKVINQETIFGGNDLGFTGYPLFNSPTQVGDAIAEAGFNVVLHATNHAADQGIQGICHCADFWKRHPEVLMAGISGEEETERVQYLAVGDVTFAVLNYTYGPNMAVLPEELRGHLNMLCDYDKTSGMINFTALNPQVTADIKEADEQADIVIVFPHWGTEYRTEPSKYQRKFAMEMTEAGADVIIGTHPHVLQPIEWVVSENGNKALCYYSLGNYASLQMEPQCMLEGMAWITFHVTQDGVTLSEERTGMLPLVCHYKSGSMRLERIYLLEEYTEELAGRHGIKDYKGETLLLSDLQTWSREILGDWALTSAELSEWF